jgi:tRNA pseudouridine55 synthase
MDGVLNINKPAGMTSHDVVAQLRRLLHEKKIGHTGTLDPDATGVLPICLGKATKIIQFLQEKEKGYEGTISLGIVTDTLDASGEVLSISDSTYVKQDDVKNVFGGFVGEIDQTPPMVSAIKFQGKRLYRLARQGKTVERKPRKVHIYDLELLDFRHSTQASGIELDFRVQCSRGTYVRALAADIGDALGCGAHLSRLVRTKSGNFELKDSIPLAEIQADPQNAVQFMRSIDDVLFFIPRIVITDPARDRFLNGIPVSGSGVACGKSDATEFRAGDLIRIHDEAGRLLGIGKAAETYSPAATLDPETVICKAVKVLRTS